MFWEYISFKKSLTLGAEPQMEIRMNLITEQWGCQEWCEWVSLPLLSLLGSSIASQVPHIYLCPEDPHKHGVNQHMYKYFDRISHAPQFPCTVRSIYRCDVLVLLCKGLSVTAVVWGQPGMGISLPVSGDISEQGEVVTSSVCCYNRRFLLLLLFKSLTHQWCTHADKGQQDGCRFLCSACSSSEYELHILAVRTECFTGSPAPAALFFWLGQTFCLMLTHQGGCKMGAQSFSDYFCACDGVVAKFPLSYTVSNSSHQATNVGKRMNISRKTSITVKPNKAKASQIGTPVPKKKSSKQIPKQVTLFTFKKTLKQCQHTSILVIPAIECLTLDSTFLGGSILAV